jgi:hypothetical protein
VSALETIVTAALGIGCLGLAFISGLISLDAAGNDNRAGAVLYFIAAVAFFALGATLWRAW